MAQKQPTIVAVATNAEKLTFVTDDGKQTTFANDATGRLTATTQAYNGTNLPAGGTVKAPIEEKAK